MEKPISRNSRELEEPEELEELSEEDLDLPNVVFPGPDHPIFKSGWTVFTLRRPGQSKKNTPDGSAR